MIEGEESVLRRIREEFAGACGDTFDDDGAALTSVPAGFERVVTADVVVEDVHFALTLSSAESAGHRAIVQNVSDLAAMAAAPSGFVWSLAIPADWYREDRIWSFVRGAAKAARTFAMPLLGGDLSSTKGPFVCSVTAFGDARPPRPRRNGARPGDCIFVGRKIGASARGLRALLAGEDRAGPQATAIENHEWPRPQLELAQVLSRASTALMDISDGLSLDLWRLLDASECGARFTYNWRDAIALGATDDDALYGGEDYALLFAIPPGAELHALVAVAPDLVEIARCEPAAGLRFPDGREVPRRGFDHVRGTDEL